jgi:hypothetical protein
MKYLLVACTLVLSACKTETTGEEINGFAIACMNGVQYYFDSAGAYGKSLAPVVDAETLTYVRCEGNKK